MNVELSRIVINGPMLPVVRRTYAYVKLMRGQHKDPSRVIVASGDYDKLMDMAKRSHPAAPYVSLCCEGIPVFYSATAPLPEPPVEPPVALPRNLTPILVSGYVNPFGQARGAVVEDDDIPF